MHASKRLLRLGIPLLIACAVALPAGAQEASAPVTGLAGQSLRPYQFVFLAYALAWLLVLGWIVAVARRMARLDRRLGSWQVPGGDAPGPSADRSAARPSASAPPDMARSSARM